MGYQQLRKYVSRGRKIIEPFNPYSTSRTGRGKMENMIGHAYRDGI
jgi:hypothetical protein